MRAFSPRILAALAFLAVAPTAPVAFATPENAGFVPRDWYTLPEEGGVDPAAPYVFSAPNANLDASLGRIFSAQREAMAAVKSPLLTLGAPQNMPKDWVPWRFAAFASDLSVSASGLVGVLSFKGTPAITVIWKKVEPKTSVDAQERQPAGETATVPVFRISDTLSAEALNAQVDAIYKTALASGRVKRTKGLRSRLQNMVGNFHDMTVAVNDAPAGGVWFPSRLRLDLEISASGQVDFGTVGGGLKIRLEWYHIAPQAPANAGVLRVARSAQQSSLRELVTAITEDLIAVSKEAPSPNFGVSQLKIGLGISAGGNIGVVKGSAQAMGFIYFDHVSPEKKVAASAAPELSPASWVLIEKSPAPETLRFAQAHGVRTFLASGATGGVSQAEYVIDRPQFREGLRKAMSIGGYFAHAAEQSSGPDWGVWVVKPGFTLSVGGSLELVKLTGVVTAELVFQNKSL